MPTENAESGLDPRSLDELNEDEGNRKTTEDVDVGKKADSDVNPLTDFVTTSYVIDSINSQLEQVMKQDGVELGGADKQQFFELQKRMPDGSTRKATDEEMSSQDMKNKLEQGKQTTEKR